MNWKGEDHSDDMTLGRCPRCRHVRPVRMKDAAAPEGFQADDEEDGLAVLKECPSCGLGGMPRNHIRGGYYRRDMLEVVDELPGMGKPCYHCGARIPRFLDLANEDHRRIYDLNRSGDEAAAIEALRAATGCPPEWARLWVTHPWGPRRPARLWVGPPCSRCGRPLRTRLARQCFECGYDWHDPAGV